VWIRDLEHRDIEVIARIHCNAWKKAFTNILPDEYLASLAPTDFAKSWQSSIEVKHRKNLVAEDSEGLQGFLSFTPFEIDIPSDGPVELVGIYVNPDRWGKGVGKKLFRAFENILARINTPSFYLWVMKDNTGARAFYESQGMFLTTDRRESIRDGHSFTEVMYERMLIQH